MYFFRADGNAKIGAGHLMRCAAIATALAEKLGGSEGIRFVCADDCSASLVTQQGFQAIVLGSDYRDMEGELSSWDRISRNSMGDGPVALEEMERHVILADSYFVTDEYLTRLGEKGYTGVMDDYGTHPYPVDYVINYNAPASLSQYQSLYQDRNTHLIIGSKYIPLRRQFMHSDYRVREQVRHVLITTGGGDRDNIAGQIWKILDEKHLEFHLVVGQFGTHYQEMKDLEACHSNLHIYHNVQNMSDLMDKCDIAITAGGSTVYELSAMGVPFICFSYAQNQEMLTNYIRNAGIAGEAGAWHRDPVGTGQKLKELLGCLADNLALRNRYWERERAMVDGQGAARLAQALFVH